MRSLQGKIGFFFFVTAALMITIFALVINYEISQHFSHYLYMHRGPGMHGMMMGQGNMPMWGRLERDFIDALRQSLIIAAAVMLLLVAGVSYYLARSIAIPVIRLNKAVNEVANGELDTTVAVDSADEVGELAQAFNTMTAKLKANSILRQRFLAGIAHELRTPLTILKANLEGIADGVIKPDSEQIGSLSEEVDRLTRMVEDLRDLSLLEAHQMRLHFSDVDLPDVIKKVAAKLTPLADAKNIKFVISAVSEIPFVRADELRVGQMVYNLAMNAIKYTPEGGRVNLVTVLEGSYAKVSVADNGIGIAQENLKHVFDHFYRVDPSRTKMTGGTGLGLAIVKQLAVAHGGRVTADSTTGQGSVFTVWLPVKNHDFSIASP